MVTAEAVIDLGQAMDAKSDGAPFAFDRPYRADSLPQTKVRPEERLASISVKQHELA